MSRIKTGELHDFLIKKDMLYAVRLTGYSHGELKKMFMRDCVQREWNESKMLNYILDVYYSIASNRPTIGDSQMDHFKKVLAEKIDLEKERESRQGRFNFYDSDQ